MNPNDEFRKHILRYFYDRNACSTSLRGKKGSTVKISDAKRELKGKHGLSQQQVLSNLTYLIDRGWIKTVDIQKTVITARGTIPSTVTWYQITALGIEKIEGDSEFKPRDRYAGINITATGNNVITMGDGNLVNAQFSALHNELNELKESITVSNQLSEAQKFDLSVDIESIKDQLAKAQPNRSFIGNLWSGIEKIVAAAGLVELLIKVQPLISGLLAP
jgi:hypothetical protein